MVRKTSSSRFFPFLVTKELVKARLSKDWQESSQDKFEFKCRAFVQTVKKPDTRMILRSILSQIHRKQPLNACKVPKLIDNIREHLQDKRYENCA